MRKGEYIIDAMSLLDDDMLEEVDLARAKFGFEETEFGEVKFKKFLRKTKPILATAACICMVVAGTMALDIEKNIMYGELLNNSAGGMGLVFCEDIYKVEADNPYRVNGTYQPAKLPVYKNLSYSLAGEPSGLTKDEMLNLLEEAATALNLEITEIEEQVNPRNSGEVFYYCTTIEDTSYYATVGDIRIEVEADGLVTITFKDGVKVAEDLSVQYDALLNFEEPVITESLEGNCKIYDGRGRVDEDLLEYYFSYAEFILNEEGKLWIIRLHNDLMSAEKVDDYFYISLEEAEEKLYKGEFYTNSSLGISTGETYDKVDLVYINSRHHEYYMPYYCFYIENEEEAQLYDAVGKCYVMYYVPAVEFENE